MVKKTDAVVGLTGGEQEQVKGAAITFPAKLRIVNDTPVGRVIGGVHVDPYESASHVFADEGALAQAKSDCEQILALAGYHGDTPGLRIIPESDGVL